MIHLSFRSTPTPTNLSRRSSKWKLTVSKKLKINSYYTRWRKLRKWKNKNLVQKIIGAKKCLAKNVLSKRWSQEPYFKVWSKSGQYQLRYSWYGQMLPGQMLLGQMSPWQLASVKDGPMSLPLKFVKIGSLTAEIFLIWTNVARRNVARTNVT